MIPANNYFKSY